MAKKASGTPKSFRFSDDELELLEELRRKYGSYKAGIMVAIRTELEYEPMSKDELLAILRERISE